MRTAGPGEGGPDDEGGPRSGLRLLLDRRYGPYLMGKALSVMGVWMFNIAAAVVAFDATGSAVVVSSVTIALFTPQLLLAPWSGARADRGGRFAQLVAGRVLCIFGAGALWAWLSLRPDEHQANGLPVVLCSLVVGLGFAVGGAAMQSVVPSLVPRRDLATAIALDTLPMVLGRVLGPAIAGILVANGQVAVVFLLAALTHLAFTGVIVVLRIGRQVNVSDPETSSVRAALTYVRGDRVLVYCLLSAAAVSVAADPALTLSPVISEAVVGDSNLVGWLASGFGVGAMVGVATTRLLSSRFGVPLVGNLGLGALALGDGLCVLANASAPAVGSMAVAGVGMTWATTSLTTQVQGRVDDTFRSRVMGLWLVAFIGSRPLAAGANGLLAEHVGVGFALACNAAVALVPLVVRLR